MLRRNARLRKEFLYRKSLEGKERELYEKKRKIREALEGRMHFEPGPDETFRPHLLLVPRRVSDATDLPEGKPIPTELQREEQALRHEVDLEDDNTAGM